MPLRRRVVCENTSRVSLSPPPPPPPPIEVNVGWCVDAREFMDFADLCRSIRRRAWCVGLAESCLGSGLRPACSVLGVCWEAP